MNVEMLYLPDEMFSQRNRRVTITFGERIPHGRFDRSKSEREWAGEVREMVYNLEKDKSLCKKSSNQ